MSKISILNLSPVGSDLFLDYMTDLSDRDIELIDGGFLTSTTITHTLVTLTFSSIVTR
ncbi:hypothetical protein [Pseudanabaena sp. PCC 6802]|uniref:hypothetical protein n=1 Tax=Pseudanabaena sp. PCC 6802 TaxID=118173 RepID=UPI00034A74AB|nr:hypothetical protein [Pseudanabaena sp. PCC 6802]